MHQRIIPVTVPGNTVPMMTFSGRPGRGVPTFYLFIRPPCPLRPCGAPPPKGGGLFGAIVKSTLPQLFIIHQRSGFIIHYSFVPRIIPLAPSSNTVSHIHRSKKPPLPGEG